MIHRNKTDQRQQRYRDWQTHSAHKMQEDVYVWSPKYKEITQTLRLLMSR